MRRSMVVMTAFVLLLASAVAFAQGGQGRRGMGRMGSFALLNMESVQKELKMTPEQIAKVPAKQQEIRQQMQDLRQSSGINQSSSQEDRQKYMDKAQDIQHKAVADILDENQMKRFDQLELQRLGPSALTRKDIAEKLKLTDDQRKQIADILRKADEDRRAAMEGKSPQSLTDEDREKLRDIQKTANDKVVAVLNEDQQKQWKDMQGEKFDFGPPAGQRGTTA